MDEYGPMFMALCLCQTLGHMYTAVYIYCLVGIKWARHQWNTVIYDFPHLHYVPPWHNENGYSVDPVFGVPSFGPLFRVFRFHGFCCRILNRYMCPLGLMCLNIFLSECITPTRQNLDKFMKITHIIKNKFPKLRLTPQHGIHFRSFHLSHECE